MKEARKELKVEEIKEKPSKIKEEESKARDYTDIAREVAGLIRENYLMGFQLGLSLWEENLKIMNNQIEQWVAAQERYTTRMRETFDKETVKFVNTPVEKMIALEKDYSNVLMNTSDRLMKGAFTVMKDGIDVAFSSFNDYMNQLRGKAMGLRE